MVYYFFHFKSKLEGFVPVITLQFDLKLAQLLRIKLMFI